MSCFIKTLDDR